MIYLILFKLVFFVDSQYGFLEKLAQPIHEECDQREPQKQEGRERIQILLLPLVARVCVCLCQKVDDCEESDHEEDAFDGAEGQDFLYTSLGGGLLLQR